jgi:putative flippase GtrA
MSKRNADGRYTFVDVHRSLAILLAISAHAINDWGIADGLADTELALMRTITRAANPSFIFMFGMMLELVYARKIQQNGVQSVAPRLIQRGFQCYLGYALTFLAAFLVGSRDLWTTLQGLFFIFGPPHGAVLRFYAVALILAVGLLAVRHRFGLRAALFLCLGLWTLQPVETWISQIHLGRLNSVRAFFLSDLPLNMTFVAGGMYLGHALRSKGARVARAFHRRAGIILAVTGCIVVVLVLQSSIHHVYTSYLDYYAYRASHHIGYYSIGLMQACLLSVVLYHIVPVSSKWLQSSSLWMGFGRSSLLSFTLGNILLIVLHQHMNVGAYVGLGLLPAYALAVLLMVAVIERSTVFLKRSPLAPRVHQIGRFPGTPITARATDAVLYLLRQINVVSPRPPTLKSDTIPH